MSQAEHPAPLEGIIAQAFMEEFQRLVKQEQRDYLVRPPDQGLVRYTHAAALDPCSLTAPTYLTII